MGVLRGDFWGGWVSKRRPDALLAKIMTQSKSSPSERKLARTSGKGHAGSGEFRVHVVVGQDLRDRELVRSTADICLLTQQVKTRHGRQHSVDIDTPQVHEKHHLK